MKKQKDPVLLVFDGSNQINRAYHAIPPIETEFGLTTNAIKGTINTVCSLIAKVRPTHIVFTIDNGTKNFRHVIHPHYKGKRDKDPEKSRSIREQVPYIRKLIKAMGILFITKNGIEADDVVGTVVRSAFRNKKAKIYIASNDKDFGQLLRGNRVTLIKNNTKTKDYDFITTENCEEHFDVPANRVIERLAIEGDKVDNIAGIKGIGIGTIKKLIATGSCPEEYDTSVLNKGQLAAWNSAQEILKTNTELVTIKTDVIDIDLDDMKIRQADLDTVLSISKYLQARGIGGTISNTVKSHLRM